MNTRKWRATWIDESSEKREYTFVAPDNPVIAEMHFQAYCAYRDCPLPEHVILEAGSLAVDIQDRRRVH